MSEGGGILLRTVNVDKLNHLGKLREDKMLDRKTVSKEIGCSEVFLSQIERKGATKRPSVNTAQKMCKLYKCSLEDIFPQNKKVI